MPGCWPGRRRRGGSRTRTTACASSQFREGPEASFITARIVGDSVSAYVRGALLNVGRKVGVASGQAVVTGEGLAGRIAEVGDNSARVLFVTDVNSRLPVLIERTRERAILAGDNSALMRLTLVQTVQGVQRGDRIVTSGHGGSFPVGIPVGEVVQTGEGQRARAAVRRLLAPRVRARRRLRRDRPGRRRPAGHARRPSGGPARGSAEMRADGLLAMLDRWGRLRCPAPCCCSSCC